MNLEEILAIIERIGGDNPPNVAELSLARTELARAIHSEARSEAPDLAVLTTLRGAFSQAGTALADAEAAEAAAKAQIDDLLADVEDPDAQPVEEPPAETPSATAEGEQDAPAADATPDATPDATTAPEPVPVAAGAGQTTAPRTLSLREAAARVRVRPVTPPETPVGTPGSNIFVLGNQVDHVPDVREVANAFERFVRSPSTGKATLIRFDSLLEDGQVLPGDTAGNTRMIDSLVGPEAVAAAGGCCSLPTPIRTQTVLSSTARPIRDSLPTIGVTTTGAVTYFPAVCLPEEGAYLWLCDDDSAVDPDDPETWKDCAFIDCPTAETTIVDAVYRCLTIGEFQRRFATEQWVAIIQATLALQARVADLRLWARMLATVNSTSTAVDTGSVFLNWAQDLQVQADDIRHGQRYDGVQLHQWAPAALRGAIRNDLIARRLIDINDPTAADTLIQGVLDNTQTNITWVGDIDQITGTPPAYTGTMPTIIAPEGHYSFLDGGQFDLGIEIRDLDLARQNAVAAFAESFEGLLARGCDARRSDIPVSICSDAPGCGEGEDV